MEKLKFTAVIKEGSGGGAFVEIPFDVEKQFGQKRVKVKVLFEGIPYRGSLVRMKTSCHILGITKDIRLKIKKDIGDSVNIVLEEDTDPRVIEIPQDILNIFNDDHTIRDKFEKLSYTHKKEYISWITEAKKLETRKSRIEKMIAMLSTKKSN